MKRIVSTFAVLLLTLGVACAKCDRPVKVEELPQAAQTLLKSYFSDVEVLFAKLDDELVYKEYEVVLADGTKIEFNGAGEWEVVECKAYAVPADIIPRQIKTYVEKNYPDVKIMKIDRDRREYEISLSNRLELTFDKRFNLVDIDD